MLYGFSFSTSCTARSALLKLTRFSDIESQEGHNPALEWRSKRAKPMESQEGLNPALEWCSKRTKLARRWPESVRNPAGRCLNALSRGLDAFSHGQLAAFAYLIAAAIRYVHVNQQLLSQGAIEPLDEAVALGVQGSGPAIITCAYTWRQRPAIQSSSLGHYGWFLPSRAF